MKKLIFVSILIYCSFSLQAQAREIITEDLKILEQLEDTLGLLAYVIINDSIPEDRFAATKKMIPTLVKALKIKNSFTYPFEQLRTVSIQYPPDSTFRIFTWQLYVDVNDYRYYGAIQMNSPELKLYPLIDRSRNVESEEQDILKPNNWYGALYYNLRQFDSPAGRHYLLFGFNGFSLFNKKKLVDVLHFENEEVVFGSPVFIQEDTLTGEQKSRNRLVLEYTAESSIRLNFDETYNQIMFDHLILMGGSYGQGPTNVPDGSYEAYRLANDGLWHWIEKVFDQVSEEAPRPEPILGKDKKDIFGNNK